MPSPEEILGRLRDAMRVEQVFGQPIEKDGLTVIPVARVMGGAGGGGGTGPVPGATGAEGAEGATAHAAPPTAGSGWGFGAGAAPAGVYVIRGGAVTWEPAVDRNRVIFVAGLVTIVTIWSIRSILVSIAKRA
jgi:uncharacterized spore protein YtfJ